MNKYQKYCFFGTEEPRGNNFVFSSCFPTVWQDPEYKGCKNTNFTYGIFDEKNDAYTVFQDEDITIVEYMVSLSKTEATRKGIASVLLYKNKAWQALDTTTRPNGSDYYNLVFDFNDRITKIKFVFRNNIADDYVCSINYVEADKEKYYAKKEQERKDELLKTAAITHSTGADLINIYFQPCCADYVRTEITLYRDGQLLAKYRVEEECFFKSITGLAYGKYSFILKQYGNADKIILESPEFTFTIDPPHRAGRQKNVVII